MKIDDEIKGHFRNDYHRGIINLVFTVKQLLYEFLKLLKQHGLTEQQFHVLRILRENNSNSPLSIGFIKDHMLDYDSDVSRLIDRLYVKKLVNRKENRSDRRQKSVEITQKGLILLEKMSLVEQKEDTLLKNLTKEEIKEFNHLLDKVREGKNNL